MSLIKSQTRGDAYRGTNLACLAIAAAWVHVALRRLADDPGLPSRAGYAAASCPYLLPAEQ
jgi:hypothetical protein